MLKAAVTLLGEKKERKKTGILSQVCMHFLFFCLVGLMAKNIFMKLFCASLSFMWSCLLILKSQTMT